MSYYVHEVPGRMRIKIPSLKRNPRSAAEVQRLLRLICGIEAISVNTVTGSVVIQFNADLVSSRTILTSLAREGYIEPGRAVSHDRYVESALARVGEVASKALLGYALDRAFQGTPLALVTAFI